MTKTIFLIIIATLFIGCGGPKFKQLTKEECFSKGMYPEIFPDGSILCRDQKSTAMENSKKNLKYRDSKEYKEYRKNVAISEAKRIELYQQVFPGVGLIMRKIKIEDAKESELNSLEKIDNPYEN